MHHAGNFILDFSRSGERIKTWEVNDNGVLSVSEYDQFPSFLISFSDPHQYYSLIEGLEMEYEVTECSFKSIYREYEGYLVKAGRDIAEKIEQQTRYGVDLFNVDIRPEQRFAAEHGIVPGGWTCLNRFIPDHYPPVKMMEISFSENPHRSEHTGAITITEPDEKKRKTYLKGSDRQNLEDLYEIVNLVDPDVILFPDYDRWSSILCTMAKRWKIPNTLSRTGRFHSLSSRSYFSYGRMEHRLGAFMPEGRLIVDTRQSFMYREGDIRGIFLASRLTGLSPNLTCRLTPGTLVSSYEVYEALARNIAVPFRKNDAEACRSLEDMRLDYRGGLTLQPQPGIYEDVTQIDFTSFYPSIIVNYNLSPETLNNPCGRAGFLPTVLKPILSLRHETKQKKKTDPSFAGMDGILKWMLVTCFGYTGYKNARFGRIEVHEQITRKASELLMHCINLVEKMNGRVLHAIVDCLFIQHNNPAFVSDTIEKYTHMRTESETYDWVVFLPQKDGSGSYTSYFGRLKNGGFKTRGVAARRRNTPLYIQNMQKEMIDLMASAKSIKDIALLYPDINEIYQRYYSGIGDAVFSDLVITRRIGREKYRKHCIPQAVIDCYHSYGVELVPGMDASYLVRDEIGLKVDPSFDPTGIDIPYYRRILDKAWGEIRFVFYQIQKEDSAC